MVLSTTALLEEEECAAAILAKEAHATVVLIHRWRCSVG
jgi:hypothetical protein